MSGSNGAASKRPRAVVVAAELPAPCDEVTGAITSAVVAVTPHAADESFAPWPPPRAPLQLTFRLTAALGATPVFTTSAGVLPHGVFERHFALGDEIGRGAFSVVHRAEVLATGSDVAVKIIDLARFRLAPASVATSVVNEVRILRELHHDNIIQIQGEWHGHSALFVVMELAAGGELIASIIGAGNFSEPQARHVLWQALKAVEYLNAHGIVHRDLKPENLLVVSTTMVPEADPVVRASRGGGTHADGENGGSVPMLNIKLADFGTARYLSDAAADTGAATFVGSPQYVAPEVLFARDMHSLAAGLAAGDDGDAPGYGRAVDIYSLGVVAFVCLAGYLPFDAAAGAASGGGWEARARAGEYYFAPPVWTHISAGAKDLIRGMMAWDPRDRLTTTQALAHDWFRPSATRRRRTRQRCAARQRRRHHQPHRRRPTSRSPPA